MPSDIFRRELQQEAQRWLEEGLISESQFQALAQAYQFQDLNTAARDRFVMILLGLGSILVGIGAITFVAANWQALSQILKAGLLFIAMLVTDLLGFVLISRRAAPNPEQRLGQALLLLGALLLGANLALMGQIVHTTGTRYELCTAWALGVLLMAYGLRLTFLGMLALLLLGVGYWSSLGEMAWLQHSLLGVWTLQMMPLLVVALFFPLAYRCKSQTLFVLSTIAMTSSLAVLILDIGPLLPPLLEAFIMVLPYACLWAYDDTLWPAIQKRLQGQPIAAMPPREMDRPFQPAARGFMVCALSLFYWALSFRQPWESSPVGRLSLNALQWQSTWPVMLTLLVFSLWTLVAWIHLGMRPQRPWRLDASSTFLLLCLLITVGILFASFIAGPIAILATITCNLLLTLMALGMMREGLGSGLRVPFWWGLVMLTLQILSRVLEYETGLLVKSVVFVVCGVGVIFVGLWFERHVQTLRIDTA
ncbi:MAG: DUF2157 domain-containing protein [Cyanobacteria bacterium P01_H01_bin.58]